MGGDQLFAVATAIWLAVTVLAFAGGAWLLLVFRREEDLERGEQPARKQIDLEEYRRRGSLIR